MSSYYGSELGGEKGGYLFKTIVVGNQGVGKSSILLQYTKQQFKQEYNVTIGVEFASKQIDIYTEQKEKKSLTVQIWDTAGQETFKSIIRSFYQKSAVAFMVYNVTKRSSFIALNEWLEEIRNNSHEEIIIVLIGNQVDQEHKREVSYEEGKQYMIDNQLDYFYETSAKTSYNIETAFKQVATIVYEKFIKTNPQMYNQSNFGESEDQSIGNYDNEVIGITPSKQNPYYGENNEFRSASQPKIDDFSGQKKSKSFQLNENTQNQENPNIKGKKEKKKGCC